MKVNLTLCQHEGESFMIITPGFSYVSLVVVQHSLYREITGQSGALTCENLIDLPLQTGHKKTGQPFT